MRKAKITVPAVSTNLGPGVGSLGLALSMHLTATFVERSDTRLVVESHGEGGADLLPSSYHPVMTGAIRVFQRVEDAPLGLRVDIRNNIPLASGLGAEVAMTAAGLIGANNLMGTPLSRDDLIALGEGILGRVDGLIAVMLGGLTVSSPGAAGALYRRVDVSPFRVAVIVPDILDYDPRKVARSKQVARADSVVNLGRMALVVDALRTNDFDLLSQAMEDLLLQPILTKHIPAYEEAAAAARDAGAVAVSLSGEGPALLAFAQVNHYKIADAVQAVFDQHNVLSRAWVLPVDTQGVVITAGETLPR